MPFFTRTSRTSSTESEDKNLTRTSSTESGDKSLTRLSDLTRKPVMFASLRNKDGQRENKQVALNVTRARALEMALTNPNLTPDVRKVLTSALEAVNGGSRTETRTLPVGQASLRYTESDSESCESSFYKE